MDSVLKQRLVGALILLALAVVFWPIIFVPPVERRDDVRVAVPTPPPVDTAPLPEPDDFGLGPAVTGTVEAGEVVDVRLPDSDSAAEQPDLEPRDTVFPEPEPGGDRRPEAPEMDADGLPLAYSLQVATVSEARRAEELRDELIAAGYKGYIERLRREQRVLHRVLVGPRFSRDELLPVKRAVDRRWGVDSVIMRYLP